MELRGAKALLTGAGGGLGGYIARALAAEGVDLALCDLPAADLAPLLADVRGAGVRAEAVPADLTDTAGLEALVRHAEAEVGPLDLLVNNAGIEFMGPFLGQTRAQLEAIVSVNLLAVMELTRVVLPGMLDRGRGQIVNIASLAGKVSAAYVHSYNATKHGVVGFSNAIRSEFADSPVGCSVICPGFVHTAGMFGRVEDRVEVPSAVGTSSPEQVAAAVVRAARENPAQIIVAKRGTKALVALGAAYPDAADRLARRAGFFDVTRGVAAAEGRVE